MIYYCCKKGDVNERLETVLDWFCFVTCNRRSVKRTTGLPTCQAQDESLNLVTASTSGGSLQRGGIEVLSQKIRASFFAKGVRDTQRTISSRCLDISHSYRILLSPCRLNPCTEVRAGQLNKKPAASLIFLRSLQKCANLQKRASQAGTQLCRI